MEVSIVSRTVGSTSNRDGAGGGSTVRSTATIASSFVALSISVKLFAPIPFRSGTITKRAFVGVSTYNRTHRSLAGSHSSRGRRVEHSHWIPLSLI